MYTLPTHNSFWSLYYIICGISRLVLNDFFHLIQSLMTTTTILCMCSFTCVRVHTKAIAWGWASSSPGLYLIHSFSHSFTFYFMYVYAACMCNAIRGQKRESNVMGLKVQIVVSCHVLGIKPGSLEEQPLFLTPAQL